jgi:hypothetical protein
MFKEIRGSAKFIIWMVVVGFVVSIFIYWGRGLTPYGRLPRIARVDGEEIDERRFNFILSRYLRLYASIYRDRFDEEMRKSLKRRVIDELIREMILENEADRVGIVVEEEEIIDEIRKPFIDDEGKLDHERFDKFINGLSQEQLYRMEEDARREIRIQKLIDLLRDTVVVTDLEVEAYCRKIGEEPDEEEFEERKEEFSREKFAKVYQQWYNSLKDKAKIEINQKFYK